MILIICIHLIIVILVMIIIVEFIIILGAPKSTSDRLLLVLQLPLHGLEEPAKISCNQEIVCYITL